MQELTYNVINGGNISMWRDIPATITITGVEDITGTWKLLIDTDFIDGVVLTGNVSVDNDALVAVIEEVNTTELRNAIRGKKSIEAKATLTNDTNQVYLFPITIKNRGMEGTPTPIQDYYTKTQTDNKFALKTVVDADVANLANNYWTKAEVAEQIANIEKLGIQVVQTLPPASEGEQFTVYLVPITGSTNNVYEEYLLINGEWQLIGTTSVDLSNYVQKTGDTITGFVNFKNGNGYNIIKNSAPSSGTPSPTNNEVTLGDDRCPATYVRGRNIEIYGGNYGILFQNISSPKYFRLGWKNNLRTASGYIELTQNSLDVKNDLNVSGNILANDVSANDVTTLSGNSLSNSLQLTGGTVGNYAHFSNNNATFGAGTAASTGNFYAYGIETNVRGISVKIGWNENSIVYHGSSAAQNTPNGFVIQNANGVIAGATDVSITYNNETVTLSSLIARIEALQQQVQQLLNN